MADDGGGSPNDGVPNVDDGGGTHREGGPNIDAGGLGIGPDFPPRLMGVLNVSDESPYAPSVFVDPDSAASYVDSLVEEGADIVDIGLASANRRLDVLPPEEELDRLEVAVEAVERAATDPVFSIETRYHEVAAGALDRGFDVVNDVCGFADPEMPRVCADRGAAVVKMASPPDLTRPGAVEETPWAERKSPEWAEEAGYVDMLYEALTQNGFTDRTILDPAFGGWSSAKTLEDDRETFRRLREFQGHGRPLLVSINRKNFLRLLADRETEEALPVSLAATAMAVERGADVVRTHDVGETRDAVLVGDAFARERFHASGADRAPGGSPGSGEEATAGDDSAASDDSTAHLDVRELDVITTSEAARHLERIGADVDLAHEATVRVLEVRGPAGVRESLSIAGGDDGGGPWVAHGDRSSLLVGTPAGLGRLRTDLPDGPLGTMLERVVGGR